jgi:DNA-binding MarR family transcriptional regulator
MTKSKAELVHEVVELDREVRRALHQHAADAWMDLDLTVPQLKTLFFIDRQGTTNTKKIAEEFGVTSSNMTGIIDRLVKQKLVSRQENPADRRMHELRVTEQGRNMLTGLREKSIKTMSGVLYHMSEEDLATLARGLSLLLKAAEANGGDM